MQISVESKEVAVTRILDYIHSKENIKKKESQNQIKEKYLNCENRKLFCLKENNISSTDETEKFSKHFKNVGSNYNNMWKFEEQFEPKLYEDISTLLDIQENDIIADLGGGTGEWTQKLKERNPSCEFLLIEPCKSMIEEAKDIENITKFLMNDQQFLEKNIYFNKMLVKYCIHHFENIKQFLDNLYERLPEGGRAVVVTLTDEAYSFPYPQVVKTYLESIMERINKFRDQFYEKNWFTKIIYRNYPVSLSQEEIRSLVVERFTSTLSLFTDEQLRNGMDDLFQNQESSEKVNFFYNLSILLMEKPYNINLSSEDIQILLPDLNILGLSEVSSSMSLFELRQQVEKII